ncbi:isopropylmalate synthase [Lysinibacillus sp. 54212]|uniref:isopropylmalate synthase n=1 Tax=Lysinibacillus sp. 54212 TaxID=3119829 RepID=UPI002FC9ED41
MKQVELFNYLNNAPIDEARKFARKNGIELSAAEVEKLRYIFRDASVVWVITGIPETHLRATKKLLGKERFKVIEKLLLEKNVR